VREPHHKEAIWQAMRDGVVGLIATDHAPHTPEEKTRADIWKADAGFPGVETQMPLMLTAVSQGRLTLEQYVQACAYNPAKAFGLLPKKGQIALGSHADLAIVDLKAQESIDQHRLHSVRARITPFHGVKVTGLPIHTLSRGRFVMRGRKLVEDAKGHGRSVHTIQHMPPPIPLRSDQSLAAVLDR
jgi:dihydroorotase